MTNTAPAQIIPDPTLPTATVTAPTATVLEKKLAKEDPQAGLPSSPPIATRASPSAATDPPMTSSPSAAATDSPTTSAPSSAVPQDPAPSPSTTWDPIQALNPPMPPDAQKFTTQPLSLSLTDCNCQRFGTQGEQAGQVCEPNDNNAIRRMLFRLRRVLLWLRDARPPRRLEDATSRVCLELRRKGHALFHLAGFEKPVSSAPESGREIHVLFLVPSPGTASGHRAVAEVVAQVDAQHTIERALCLSDVAERYEDDWSRWETSQDFECPREESKSEDTPQRVRLGQDGMHTAVQVRDRMWADVAKSLQGDHREAEKDFFGQTLVRAVKELAGRGEVFSAYEVEVGHWKTDKGAENTPAVMVSLLTVPRETLPKTRDRPGEGQKDEVEAGAGQQDATVKAVAGGPVPDRGPLGPRTSAPPGPKPKSLRSRERASAVIVLNLTGNKDQQGCESVAVIYDGEWPVSHTYRQTTPAPDLAGLEYYVKKTATRRQRPVEDEKRS